MDQKVIELYDEYTHKPLERREFLTRLAALAGGMTAAQALLPQLESNYAQAKVPSRTPGLIDNYITYPGPSGDIRSYVAKPAGEGKHPAVIIIHENRGLNPHIEDVTRRIALAGFLSLAPDALSPVGATPADADKARELISQLDSENNIANYLAAVTFLKDHPESTGAVGAVGFCWGGGVANELAVRSPELKAAVAFYGRQPAPGDVPRIKAAVLLHYAGLDTRINQGIPEYEAALKENKIKYKLYMYEGVNHAFHNDTSEARYDAEAAKLAWQRTVDFLHENLG